jgi:hypothetical protein
MNDTVCKVCDYEAECIYDGKPMCYLCRENSAKAKREMAQPVDLTGDCEKFCTDTECNCECESCVNSHGVPFNEYPEDNMTDAEADADTLASAGWGTDEDYGYYGDD